MRSKIYNIIEFGDSHWKCSLIYNRFMYVCIICSLIPLCFKQTNVLFIWTEHVTVSTFLIMYFVG